MKDEILQFINDFKKLDLSIEILFMEGYCYWFAFILKERFNGDIWYFPIENHFITKIGNSFYDICGEINMDNREKPYNWDEFKKYEPINSKVIERDCILKQRRTD